MGSSSRKSSALVCSKVGATNSGKLSVHYVPILLLVDTYIISRMADGASLPG